MSPSSRPGTRRPCAGSPTPATRRSRACGHGMPTASSSATPPATGSRSWRRRRSRPGRARSGCTAPGAAGAWKRFRHRTEAGRVAAARVPEEKGGADGAHPRVRHGAGRHARSDRGGRPCVGEGEARQGKPGKGDGRARRTPSARRSPTRTSTSSWPTGSATATTPTTTAGCRPARTRASPASTRPTRAGTTAATSRACWTRSTTSQGLGTTAIWLTPSFKNKAVQDNDGFPSAGYHGYWITDFTQIDPHLGTNQDLRNLVDAAHARGIKVYFDIITNHTADVIQYQEGAAPQYISKDRYPYRDAGGHRRSTTATTRAAARSPSSRRPGSPPAPARTTRRASPTARASRPTSRTSRSRAGSTTSASTTTAATRRSSARTRSTATSSASTTSSPRTPWSSTA